ncbi:MAG: type II glyceraldehyde-3-phosphate dehydrogenase [Halobacteriales archaeon]
MIQVGINGYGTIGKRVADAVRAQPDMAVCGVAKNSPNYGAKNAVEAGYQLFAPDADRVAAFEEAGYDPDGTVEDLVATSDVIVDATPSGFGAENKELYQAHDTPAIFQGGEDEALVDTSFNARSNFEDAIGADYVRVVSCNTTGIARVVAPLRAAYGIEKVRATLVRRGGDPAQSGRGPINDILPDPTTIPSHHGPDVNTIFPDLDIDTLGLKVPATLMHVHSLNITLETTPETTDVLDDLIDERRLFVVPGSAGIDGVGKLKEFAADVDRPRGDLWENCIWGESVTVEGRDLYLFQAIHQESDVVPENIDAIRAMTETADAAESMQTTDEVLGVGFPEREQDIPELLA